MIFVFIGLAVLIFFLALRIARYVTENRERDRQIDEMSS